MSISLENIIALGESGAAAVKDVIADVEAGLKAEGGVAMESIAVVEALIADAKFKSDLAALVSAIKSMI